MAANSGVIVVSKYAKVGQGFSVKEQRQGWEHGGRRTDGSQSAASWIADLTDLQKTIILCSYCRVHFNPRKNHYRKMYVADPTGKTDGYQVNGKCDNCKQFTANAGGGTAFVHESLYNNVCQDPVDARRIARAKAKALGAWQHIQRHYR